MDGIPVNCPKCSDGKIVVDLENAFESMEVIIDGIYIGSMQIGNGYDSCGKPFTKKGTISHDFRSAQKIKSKNHDSYYEFKSFKEEKDIFIPIVIRNGYIIIEKNRYLIIRFFSIFAYLRWERNLRKGLEKKFEMLELEPYRNDFEKCYKDCIETDCEEDEDEDE